MARVSEEAKGAEGTGASEGLRGGGSVGKHSPRRAAGSGGGGATLK